MDIVAYTKAMFENSGSFFNWALLVNIVVIAAITMALLQLVKDFLPIRWGFQQFWMSEWVIIRARKFNKEIGWKPERRDDRLVASVDHLSYSFALRVAPGRLEDIAENLSRGVLNVVNWLYRGVSWIGYIVFLKFLWESNDRSNEAWTSLIELAAGGRKRSLFRLPSEQMIAQISSAAQIVLEYPDQYEELLAVLSQGADIEDLKVLKDESKASEAPPPQSATAPKRRTKKSEAAAPSAIVPEPEAHAARNRVAHRIQRNLDAIHVALAGDWKFFMQTSALAISMVLAFLPTTPDPQRPILVSLFVGLAAGYLAPVMQDIVAAVQTARRR